MKRIWYHIIKVFISTGLFFFFKKILVNDSKNIPKKGAVLLVSNHKNALIDPLLIATTTQRNIHFLTRASAFKVRPIKWLLSTVNMLPIYRLRDGKETLAKNEIIFNKCFDILNKNKSLLIFPEATHDIRRLIRPLSKGFTRITFGFLEQNPKVALRIVPVGLNYTNAEKFGESVSIYYGKPILVNDYFDPEDLNSSTLNLKNVVSESMKELTTHIDPKNYDKTVKILGNVDYLNPKKVNDLLKELPNPSFKTPPIKEPSIVWKFLKVLVSINSFAPILIYKAIAPNIKEIEFVSTTKFAIGITAFPVFYLVQSLAVFYYAGIKIAIIYAITSVLLVLLLAKTK